MTKIPEGKLLEEWVKNQDRMNALLYSIYMQRQAEQANKVPAEVRLTSVTTDAQGPPYRWVQLCSGNALRGEVMWFIEGLTSADQGVLFIASTDTGDPFDAVNQLNIDASALPIFNSGTTINGIIAYVVTPNLQPIMGPNTIIRVPTTGPLYAFGVFLSGATFAPQAISLGVIETLYQAPQSIPQMLGLDGHAKGQAGHAVRPIPGIDHIAGDEISREPVLH